MILFKRKRPQTLREESEDDIVQTQTAPFLIESGNRISKERRRRQSQHHTVLRRDFYQRTPRVSRLFFPYSPIQFSGKENRLGNVPH